MADQVVVQVRAHEGARDDADYDMTTESYPNGVVANSDYDNAGEQTQLQYSDNGSTWMTFADTYNTLGQVAKQSSPESQQSFGYDGSDRLINVQDVDSGSCTTRDYTYDNDSNRTSLESYLAATDGSCSTAAGSTTISSGYDQADRIKNTGYTYDGLGRTLTVPAADAFGAGGHTAFSGTLSLGYYANDMVANEGQGSDTISYLLDPDQNRVQSFTDNTTSTTNHYADDTDSPAWSQTGSTWTRDLLGPAGNLVAEAGVGSAELEMTNLHGDVVATCVDSSSTTGPDTYSESTEFGQSRTSATAINPYGWLGGDERSSDDLGGLTLMGARLYDPQTGRFLSVDPLYDGNANAYVYPTDPMDGADPSGLAGEPEIEGIGGEEGPGGNDPDYGDLEGSGTGGGIEEEGGEDDEGGKGSNKEEKPKQPQQKPRGRREAKSVREPKEHTTNRRRSNRQRHENGQERKVRDRPGGEKGDRNRQYHHPPSNGGGPERFE